MTQNYNNEIDEGRRYLWYQYSKSCAVHNFDVRKYKKMKIENTYYVYDNRGLLLGIICGPSDKKSLFEVKKYILMKIFLNLWKGGTDYNFSKEEKKDIRREEWNNLKTYIKSKLRRKDEKTAKTV